MCKLRALTGLYDAPESGTILRADLDCTFEYIEPTHIGLLTHNKARAHWLQFALRGLHHEWPWRLLRILRSGNHDFAIQQDDATLLLGKAYIDCSIRIEHQLGAIHQYDSAAFTQSRALIGRPGAPRQVFFRHVSSGANKEEGSQGLDGGTTLVRAGRR
ncbi:hypothetical protein D3C81_1710720 [compost metagenome]